MSEKTDEWFPTMAGNYTAYVPEYEDDNGDWHEVPTADLRQPLAALGVPPPRWNGGITRTLGLFGRAQAFALAWQYAAAHEADGKEVNVRVAQFEVRYDLKAKRLSHTFTCDTL